MTYRQMLPLVGCALLPLLTATAVEVDHQPPTARLEPVPGVLGSEEPAIAVPATLAPETTTSTAPSTTTTSTTAVVYRTAATVGADAGGDGSLHDRIQGCESAGHPGAPPDYTADNPSRASTASGAAQYLDSTWAGYGGYSRAMHAPPAVQEARFAADLLTVGTGPWAASRSCWAVS